MNRTLTNTMQTLLNSVMRTMVGLYWVTQVPSAPLWDAFRTPPVCALAAGRRARAYKKCFALQTTVGTLIRMPMLVPKWTWCTGTVRWINRFAKPYLREACEIFQVQGDDGVMRPIDHTIWPTFPPQQLRDVIVRSLLIRERLNRLAPGHSTGLATNNYFRGGYQPDRNLTRGRVFCKPREHWGIALVLQCRIGAYMTGPLLVEAERLPPRFGAFCPFCRQAGPETLYHMFFTCRAWRTIRRKVGLRRTIAKVRRVWHQKQNSTSNTDALFFISSGMASRTQEQLALSWILGGIYGRKWGVKGYMPKPPAKELADGDVSLSDSSDEEALAGDRNNTVEEQAHLLTVGRFLVTIEPLRRRIISRPTLITQNLGDQGPPAPATSTGQRPDG